jgi:hypothetical protein
MKAKIPCALLTAQGGCGGYPARPIKCRSWTSFDPGKCEQAFHQNPPRATVPVHPGVKAVGDGTMTGLRRGPHDAGMDAGGYELNSAVLCALETPDAAARWASGENIFAQCRTADE